MTARRLINKKAYDELVLLEKRCAMEKQIVLKPMLVLTADYRELFTIQVLGYGHVIKKELIGKNYKEIEMALTSYLVGIYE
jgi:hypothetical protein